MTTMAIDGEDRLIDGAPTRARAVCDVLAAVTGSAALVPAPSGRAEDRQP
jgi:hypothetical protein